MYKIPHAINRFNMYKSGNRLVGVTEEVALPEVKYLSDTLEGAGFGGSMDMPIIGLTEGMQMTIPYMALSEETFDVLDPTEPANLTLRGALQLADKSTGKIDFVSIAITVRGVVKEFKPGSIKAGAKMGSSVTLELSYYKIELDKKVMYEIDKLNSIFIVNGHDVLEKVRNMC